MFFFFLDESYVAVIGDIIKSKQLPDRNQVQHKLTDILKEINQKYADELASNFMVTLGDEFQGLLKCGKSTMSIISEIEMQMYPVKIRFGLGVGKITTAINRDIPLGADGPAYYNARKMIDALKGSEKKLKKSYSNIMISIDGDESGVSILFNSILSLCSTIKQKWSKRQREIISAYIEHDNNQVRTASYLNIKQSSVHKGLSTAGYFSYTDAIDAIAQMLSQVGEKKDV